MEAWGPPKMIGISGLIFFISSANRRDTGKESHQVEKPSDLGSYERISVSHRKKILVLLL